VRYTFSIPAYRRAALSRLPSLNTYFFAVEIAPSNEFRLPRASGTCKLGATTRVDCLAMKRCRVAGSVQREQGDHHLRMHHVTRVADQMLFAQQSMARHRMEDKHKKAWLSFNVLVHEYNLSLYFINHRSSTIKGARRKTSNVCFWVRNRYWARGLFCWYGTLIISHSGRIY